MAEAISEFQLKMLNIVFQGIMNELNSHIMCVPFLVEHVNRRQKQQGLLPGQTLLSVKFFSIIKDLQALFESWQDTDESLPYLKA